MIIKLQELSRLEKLNCYDCGYKWEDNYKTTKKCPKCSKNRISTDITRYYTCLFCNFYNRISFILNIQKMETTGLKCYNYNCKKILSTNIVRMVKYDY